MSRISAGVIILVMDEKILKERLEKLPLGWLEYHSSISSTNDRVAEWAEVDAPSFSVVIADEQTRGRGRFERKWFTPPGSALAFTVLLRIKQAYSPELIMRLTALGAVAVREALASLYQIPAQIKWPNDVLIGRQKTCGVLAEAHWMDEQLLGILLGIGVNVFPDSIPEDSELNFPASCVQAHSPEPVDRLDLLEAILGQILDWASQTHTPVFLQKWADSLAFVGEQVFIRDNADVEYHGHLMGLTEEGKLELKLHNNERMEFQTAEIHLRPGVDSR